VVLLLAKQVASVTWRGARSRRVQSRAIQ
jgi:hypothetical protein